MGCYDTSDQASFDKLAEMTDEALLQLGEKALKNLVLYLVGTKSDKGSAVDEA